MDYHFIQMKPTKAFLSIVDPNKKSRFVCFNDKKTAEVFVNYVTTFRSKHGFWPNLDMSKGSNVVKSKVGTRMSNKSSTLFLNIRFINKTQGFFLKR